jgi:sphingomyelin phosphodiesterase acid-like 3
MYRFRSRHLLTLLSLLLCTALAPAQHRAPARREVKVVMLSDLHFDPFYDPAKFAQLNAAPVSRWAEILGQRSSVAQMTDFSALQEACHIRGVDSPWALVASSLHEARLREPKPLFVTVGGDLLAHGFGCKFQLLNPHASTAELSSFSAKTVAFVALQLRLAFPGTPVFFALGNNDSGCGDYRETPDGAFLHAVAASFAEDLINPANRSALLSSFPKLGDYTAELPAPMHKTRLIVLQNIFDSTHYVACDAHGGTGSAAAQIAWLHAQLTEARTQGEQVWVMAHIPPGVDIYTTFHRYLFAPAEACNVKTPQMFLSSPALGDTLAEFADVVRLGLFAHTHMDEIRLLSNAQGEAVAAKLVPSISPINGNDPAFLVAEVSPQTATLQDYTAYVAADAKGSSWAREYRYSEAYGLPDFSAASVRKLTSSLIADSTGEDETSRNYERYFLAGSGALGQLGLQRLWPEYSCSLREQHSEAFHSCMCPAATPAKQSLP